MGGAWRNFFQVGRLLTIGREISAQTNVAVSMLWSKNGFGFTDGWIFNDQSDLLEQLFRLQEANKA